MDFDDIIKRRRSVRRFSDRRPEPAVVDHVIDQARRAPTAGFSQGVDFLVLDDEAALDELWTLVEDPEFPDEHEEKAYRPPVLVLVWSDPQRYLRRYAAEDKAEFGLADEASWPVRFWDIDAAMAAMQLQLAAVNQGLDTWFFGISYGEAAVRARFGVPSDRRQVGVVALGYRFDGQQPTSSFSRSRRRPLEEQLHRNGW
ncbi:MAG: nitroreductase family protein [Candidatus Limnocylindrales bacterium]